jgi:hypothetical protein
VALRAVANEGEGVVLEVVLARWSVSAPVAAASIDSPRASLSASPRAL